MALSIDQKATLPKHVGRAYGLGPFILPVLADQRARAFTMLIISLFALAFFAFFAISPTITTIAELRKRVEDAELVDKKLQAKITNLSQLQKAYPTIQSDIPIIFDALPPQGRPGSLLGKLKALTNRSSIIVTGMQVQQVPLSANPTNTEASVPIFFTLTGIGTYESISGFLTSLTGFDRLVNINDLTLSRIQGKEGGKTLSLSLRGTAYVLFEK